MKQLRHRTHLHRQYVRRQECCVCGATGPSDPHHLKFAQPRAMGMKVSDEFCVPLCRRCHEEVEVCGDEAGWWVSKEIDALKIAATLWKGEVPF